MSAAALATPALRPAGPAGPAAGAPERVARLAARLAGAPLAVVSLADGAGEWTLAATGFAEDADPATVLAAADPACVLAAPVETAGRVAGWLRVADHAPRRWTADEAAALADLAATLAAGLERGDAARPLPPKHDADARYRTLVDQFPAITYLASTEPGSPTLYTSPQTEALLGYTPAEWTADPTLWLERIHPDDRARVEAEWSAAHDAGRPFAAEYRIRARDGGVLWFRDQASTVRDAQGRPLCIQGVMIDVTAHRQAEDALRQSEESIRALHRITTSATLSSSQKIGALLEMGSRRFGVPTGVLSHIAGEQFRVVECHSADGSLAAGSRLALEEVYCGRVHADGETLSIDHASASAWAAHRCCTRLGVEAYVGTPVTVGGTPFGTLCFFGSLPREVAFTESDRDFLRLMGQWVGAELERQRALEELRAEEARYRTLVESASDLIFSTDDAGRLTYANPAALRALGRDPADVLGRPALELVRPDARDRVRAAVAEQGEAAYLEVPLHTAAGGELWVGASLHLAVADGRATGARAVARDITARREVDRIHAEFVSVVSHELRTPLTALRGSLGLLSSGRMGPVPERGQRLLEIAVGNTDRLVRLINDILDVERLESGRATLRTGDVSVPALLSRAAEAVAPEAERRGMQLAVRSTRATVRGDADLLLQALLNLLGNAFKFSPAGGVVTLAAATHEGELRLRVSDQGRGIAAERLDTVFERFRQGDSSDARAEGGTGLGLAICRSIVAQHGGRIWAESAPGEGATLWIALPLAAAGEVSASAPAAAPPRTVPVPAMGLTVLLVEADADLAGVLTELLAADGVASHHARTAADALSLAGTRRVDAVILELALADGDGVALAERLHADERLHGVPLLVYTARDPDGAALGRLAAAGAALFTKSRITPDAFAREVMARLGRVPVAAAKPGKGTGGRTRATA